MKADFVMTVNIDARRGTAVLKILAVFINLYAWIEKKVIKRFRKQPLELVLTVGRK